MDFVKRERGVDPLLRPGGFWGEARTHWGQLWAQALLWKIFPEAPFADTVSGKVAAAASNP